MITKLITKKITTAMIFFGICLLGIISLNKLSVQLLPDIEFPMLTIITPYENAAPSEVEKLVSSYIEEAASSVNGVRSIYSESLEGLSLVTTKFEWDTDMDLALIETKEKVDMIKGQLPEDTAKSIVVKFDPKADPIMIYSIVNKKGDFKKVRKRIDKEILPQIERIEGVALVDMIGGYKRQINIELDSAKIFSHNISLAEIMQNISLSNYNFPAGNVKKDNKEYLVRTTGEFKKISEIDRVVVARSEQGIPIYLGNIAEITDSFKERKSIIRLNGKESVALLIRKEPGKNTVDTCTRVNEKFKELNEKFKKELSIKEIYDQSSFITNSVNNVFSSAILGGLIAIFILWVFLKEMKAPLIIATSIPISIIGTFALMYFKGISINTMSLGGLALGVGMMVDSGIVVLESISKKKEKVSADKEEEAVIEGTLEIKNAVISSILTSIVVFLPIVFLSGLSGAIFGELALTISFALIFSLFTSIILIPMLATLKSKNLKKGNSSKTKLKKKIFSISDLFINASSKVFSNLTNKAIENRKKTMWIGTASLVIGLGLFFFIDKELMPVVDPGEFSIDIESPRGTTLEESSALSQRIENYLLKKPYVKYVFSQIGSDPDDNIAEKTSGRSVNNIIIRVLLKSNRSDHIKDIVSSLQKEIKFGEQIRSEYFIKENVVESIISNRRKPVHIEIYGREKDQLREIGNLVKNKLSEIEGLKNIQSIYDKKDPELKIDVDRDRIAALGVSIGDVASTIKSAIQGEVVSRFRDKDDEIDIRVRLREKDRNEKESLGRILVKAGNESTIPINKFTKIIEGHGSSKLIRSEQSRVNIITADTLSDEEDILDDVENVISSLKFQEGYECKVISAGREISKTFSEMQFALLLAIILIYMLLASQFQSLLNPLIVMLSIPVTMLGVSSALLLAGKTLNINSGIGIIMLTGLVVNNAIVLFDYIEIERKAGKNIKNAILDAGTQRLKPILMTTLTTIFALLPIALGIGQGSELQQPMAISVIGGLTVSTFLTLIFMPVIYLIINEKKEKKHTEKQLKT